MAIYVNEIPAGRILTKDQLWLDFVLRRIRVQNLQNFRKFHSSNLPYSVHRERANTAE